MSASSIASRLVSEAGTYVYTLFKEKLPDTLLYHDYHHTVDVANDTRKIGRKEGLGGEEQALAELAAWFHDTGFVETYDGHEEVSVRIATGFLTEHGLPEKQVERVAELIRSTHPDREPKDPAEKVLHDADICHAGKKKKFFRYAERLRRELEHRRAEPFTDREWAEKQVEFLSNVRFYTDEAKKQYENRRKRNLRDVRRHLADIMDAERAVKSPQPNRGEPSRGIETMFRTAYRNHINLSAIADSKANIMISINAILMSIIISYVSTKLQTDPWLAIPAAVLLLTSLAAIVFAILSARPKVTSEAFTIEDVRRNRANILFFGNFVNMPREEFTVGIREIMGDYDKLYDSMISDLHSLGGVLDKKYRLLWISYTVFMSGLTVSVLLFLGLLLFV